MTLVVQALYTYLKPHHPVPDKQFVECHGLNHVHQSLHSLHGNLDLSLDWQGLQEFDVAVTFLMPNTPLNYDLPVNRV